MNVNQILNMVVRMVMRRALNSGIKAGLTQAGKLGRRTKPAQKRQAPDEHQDQDQMRG